MRPRLDTSVLLLERRPGSPSGPNGHRPGSNGHRRPGRVLFLAHRAADGWLALDLTGPVTERFVPGGGMLRPEIVVVRGGDSFLDRILPLYALDRDPEIFGGLRVPGPGGAQFGLGGDVDSLFRASIESTARERSSRSRLRFFRGLSRISCRSRAVPEGSTLVRATPELVFETRPDVLWEEAVCLA